MGKSPKHSMRKLWFWLVLFVMFFTFWHYENLKCHRDISRLKQRFSDWKGHRKTNRCSRAHVKFLRHWHFLLWSGSILVSVQKSLKSLLGPDPPTMNPCCWPAETCKAFFKYNVVWMRPYVPNPLALIFPHGIILSYYHTIINYVLITSPTFSLSSKDTSYMDSVSDSSDYRTFFRMFIYGLFYEQQWDQVRGSGLRISRENWWGVTESLLSECKLGAPAQEGGHLSKEVKTNGH